VKAYLAQLLERAPTDRSRNLLVREYLQARILQCLQDRGVFVRWAFLGGTALRFLFAIPRFSEDLDFSALRSGDAAGLEAALSSARHTLQAEGYRVEVSVKDERAVASGYVKFPGLLHELGLSPRAEHVLSIKLEVDTNPPAGAVSTTSIVRRHVTLNLCHYDQASLLAGKLHAVLTRPWPKGRDLYDLAWYLADRAWPAPNLSMLNAALAQTQWDGPVLTEGNWRTEARRQLTSLNWTAARADVRPFLEHERDMLLVTPDALDQLLSGVG
jgi:predicted nucleotidyltransferase component of viral defense system